MINGHSYKLADFATVEKGQSPQKVAKENQQYRLCSRIDILKDITERLCKKKIVEYDMMTE